MGQITNVYAYNIFAGKLERGLLTDVGVDRTILKYIFR
jgi:hypothetical protein